MNKWSAHMLTGMKTMTKQMKSGGTCRPDAGGSACRRGVARGAWRVARVAVVAVMALVFGVAGFVANATAAVAIDGTWSSVAGTGNSTLNHSAGTGSDRVVYVSINSEMNGAQSAPAPAYGGVSMTFIGSIQEAPGATGYNNFASMWYCDETCIAGAANTTITPNYSATPLNDVIHAATLTGVDQTVPIAASNTTSSANDTISLNLANAAGDMGIYTVEFNDVGANSISTPANFTEGAESDTTGTGFRAASGSSTTSGTLTVNPTNTGPTSNRTTLLVVSFQQVQCSDTNASSVTLTDPTNGATVSGSITITTNLNNATNVEYSIDGGAWTSDLTLWNSANTHPASTSAPVAGVTVDVRAIEDECGGYVTDSITVTVDNTCTESTQSSIIWNGTTSAAGDFSGASFVTATDVNTLEYQVTTPGSVTSSTCQVSATGEYFFDALEYNVAGTTFDTSGTYLVGTTASTGAPTGTPTSYSIDFQNTGVYYLWINSAQAGFSWWYGLDGTMVGNGEATLAGFSWRGAWFNSGPDPMQINVTTTGLHTLDIWGRETGVWIDGIILTQDAAFTPTGTAEDSTGGSSHIITPGSQCSVGSPETTVIPWTADPISASGVLTDGNSYNLYARGLDTECGVAYYGDTVAQSVSPGTSQSFTWSACTETRTLTLQPITDPITGDVTVTATGTATGISVGTTPAAGNASGWVYTPAQDDNTTTVSFYATGAGICGTLTDSQLNVSTNTMAAPIITAFTIPATVVDTAAPLDVPITTFTATDNVAVTGYMITESATAPGAGDAGWSASAPTSYTVGAYGPYTLYAWTKDAAGNVSASASASTTISNCSPTVTAISIAAATNPINYPDTSTAFTVAISGGSGTISSTMYSVDGGAWTATATPFVAPSQTVGSVSVSGQAVEDNCSTIMTTATPVTVNYDTRTPYIEPGAATSAQLGVDKVRVTAPFLGINDNASFRLSVAYSLNGAAQTPVTVDPVSGAGPQIIDLGPFADGDAITTIEVTYADTRWSLAPGNAVQNLADITMVAWVDNQLLHNSLRFACSVLAADGSTITSSAACTTAGGNWNEDRRHTGGWGTSGADDQYGAIICSTCHVKDSGNIKRVVKLVSLAGIPGAAENNITYTSAVDGSADLGSTSADGLSHTASNRICEVCHTYSSTDPNVATPTGGVRFHAYNMSATTETHAVDSDCISCHEHKVGFRASCAACHGNPPETGKLVTKASSGPLTTGSTTAGAHLVHVNTQGIDCALCHAGSVGGGATHNTDGTVTLTFANLPTGTGGATGGSYDGQAAVTYDTTDATNTTLTKTGTKTCANYCHGSTINGASPVWDGTAACGSCHAVTAAAVNVLPSGISHNTHVNQGKDCSFCHGAGYSNVSGSEAAPAGHVDGAIVYDVSTLPSGTTATYKTAASGTINNLAPSGTYGSCANVTCHGSGTPTWNDAASVACGSCHGTTGTYSDARDGAPPSDLLGGTDTNKVGKHAAHLSISNTLTGNYCNLCHNGAGSGTAQHADGGVDFAFNTTAAGATAAYTAGTPPTCSGLNAANCHSGTAQWSTTATIACTDCHTGSGAGAKAVGSTSSHTLVTTGGTFGDCTDCHGGHYGTAGGVDIPNNLTVGINYGHGGIKLGGTGTDASISGKITEAEICWGCHDLAANNISEFGVNSKANTGSMAYNYGTLNQSNWVAATWTSGVAKFGYKTGTIQSTHSVNPAATGPGMDAVGTIRCSYCHDVHNLNLATGDSLSGAPYLRGTWMGNPYPEDGAPLSGDSWTTNIFGAVPRGTNAANELGGFQIDQNNGNPTTGWTANSSAGLCELCHGNGDGNFTAAEIDSLNQFGTASTDWVGTNGHSAAVLGGGDSVAVNIFTVADRNNTAPTVSTNEGASAGNPAMAYQQISSGTGARAFGFRSSSAEPDGWNLAPRTTNDRAHDSYNWGANTQTGLDSNYHNFSCSKCHNPHASRLPRLMITNCLDTRHNTWDDQAGVDSIPSATTQNADRSATPSTDNANVTFSQSTSAQNCHRVADPAYPQANGAGWNNVTPW